ncbi:glycerol-3-phosphate dehydrogenase [NAD(+)], cytoplasmic-like [Condylostylus longicornis]|uniref:glycerol-3-phosphate dehydrogenase [NAD(+)], cytoplasmic-like n=1 Tax=Condylostylus longicornis TaxID=2530218 RepID=UPI00244DA9C4|nr:glycerol-3-phosphate dehydrogenase [NAD(+)], cytoplasmic-like [Condylostylus longicornis]
MIIQKDEDMEYKVQQIIAVIGSGNWGAAITTIIGKNAGRTILFKPEVSDSFCVSLDGTAIQNVVSLQAKVENEVGSSGVSIPVNIKATPNLVECVTGADLLVFVLPHQFLPGVLRQIEGNVKPGARAISLIKGFHVDQGRPSLFTEMISKCLKVDCSILSGANVASGVAKGEFCETTIGYSVLESARIWQMLFDTPAFKVDVLPDIKETFLESAGLADTITTCFGGRNVRCAGEFVKRRGPVSISDPERDEELWSAIELELLNGQKLQGTLTTKDVYSVIEYHQLHDAFPLFTTTHHIAFRGLPSDRIVGVFMLIPPSAHLKSLESSRL